MNGGVDSSMRYLYSRRTGGGHVKMLIMEYGWTMWNEKTYGKRKIKKGTYSGKNCKREHKCFSPLLSDICIDPPRKLVFF